MNARKIIFTVICTSLLCLSLMYSQGLASDLPKLIIFYSPTCHRCMEVKKDLLPEIEKEFKDTIELEYRDISSMDNYKLLLSLREKNKTRFKIDVPIFYLDGHFLLSRGKITKTNFTRFIMKSLNMPPAEKGIMPAVDLVAYFKAFTPLTIISAGLVDGINPCAFTVIVFFISFLALQGYKKKELIAIGLCFIGAVFLTYLLIGLGLFNFFYRLKEFWLIARIVNVSIGIFSIILGVLAIFDFLKFKKTGQTQGLFLQLPQSVKNRIHHIIGMHYRKTPTSQPGEFPRQKHILKITVTALFTGFLVSLLEAICTGQTYLPTITFILKTTPLKLQALGYLLVYNFMFIVPLLIIFFLGLLGVTSEQFSGFLKKHLLTIKVFMAILFFVLGIFLIWRG